MHVTIEGYARVAYCINKNDTRIPKRHVDEVYRRWRTRSKKTIFERAFLDSPSITMANNSTMSAELEGTVNVTLREGALVTRTICA